MMNGFDVSRWQGNINWDKAKTKVDFSFIKCSEGQWVDEQFMRNWAEAKRVGVKRGAYMFYRALINAGDQARTMIAALAGDYGELPLVVDLEDTKVGSPWSATEIADLRWVLDILEKFSGKTPIIYSAKWWADPYIGSPAWIKRYELWVANYVPSPDIAPAMPSAWSTWKYFQWTSTGIGADYGVQSADIDLDIDASVVVPPPQHPVPTLVATPATITAGGATTIAWNAPGSSQAKLGSTVVASSGSLPFSPSSTTYFLFTVSYPGEKDVVVRADVVVTPKVVPLPVVTGNVPLLGVDVIFTGDDARKCAAAGVKYLAIAGNGQLAKEMMQQHPEIVVTHRAMYYKGHLPSWAEFQDFHGYALTSGMIVYGVNENDQIGDQFADIQKRADWDWEMFQRCRDKGIGFIAGGYAMGTPDVTQKQYRDALRAHYVPKIVAGMNRFNQHLYTGRTGETNPPDIKLRIYRDTITDMIVDGITVNNFRATWWLEERVRWYTAWCGFPDTTEFWCDEFGMDETPGGFKAHNMSAADVVAYLNQFKKLHSQPTIINGVAHKHILKCAALFQKGSSNWGSYDITDEYLAAIQQAGAW